MALDTARGVRELTGHSIVNYLESLMDGLDALRRWTGGGPEDRVESPKVAGGPHPSAGVEPGDDLRQS